MILALLFGAFVYLLLLTYTSYTWGLVLFKFWGWFLLPVFPMVGTIDYWQAIGLAFIVSLFIRQSSVKTKGKEIELTDTLISIGLAPWMTLLGGWIAYAYIIN